MSTRIRPVRFGESDDPELNQLLRDWKEGW